MDGRKILIWAAALALLAVAIHAAPANATAVNATQTNATQIGANATQAVNATGPAANATQLPNATEVYVVTPSGTIHLVYASNGTRLVINYNRNVITVNLKTAIYNGTTAYYIHAVGHALGAFNSTYMSQVLSQIAAALKGGNTTQALSLLKQLAGYVASSNATKEAELNIMLAAKSLNATMPNATYLTAKLEYEVERNLGRVNGTSNELEVKAAASNLSQIAAFLNAVASQVAQYSPADAAQLRQAAALLANLTVQFKETEIALANGTHIEIHKTAYGYKVEVQIGGEHHESEHHEKHGGKAEHHEDDSWAKAAQGGKHHVKGGKASQSGGQSQPSGKQKSSGSSESSDNETD